MTSSILAGYWTPGLNASYLQRRRRMRADTQRLARQAVSEQIRIEIGVWVAFFRALSGQRNRGMALSISSTSAVSGSRRRIFPQGLPRGRECG